MRVVSCATSRPATPSIANSSPSTLDALPEPLKLNAVAESLARSRDVPAALSVVAELKRSGATLEPRARAAIVDAIASAPGPAAARNIAQLFAGSPPWGFGDIYNPVSAQPKRKIGADQDATGADDALPDAGRRVDMSLAAGFLVVVGTAVSAEVVEPLVLHHAATEATTVLLVVMGGLTFDRFAAAGTWWNRLTGGIERLLSDDPAREASVEAAFFLVAYLLGLPCAPFKPNVPQLLKLHAAPSKVSSAASQAVAAERAKRKQKQFKQRTRKDRGRDAAGTSDVATVGLQLADTSAELSAPAVQLPPLDDKAVDRYLIWLMAGVAAEALMDGLLVESDAARARALLRAAGGGADNARLSSAYRTARQILTQHQVLHAKLTRGMLEGLSAGQCINLVDSELKR